MPMGGELVLAQQEQAVAAAVEEERLPVLVERAGGAARFAWDEFFYAEHQTSTRNGRIRRRCGGSWPGLKGRGSSWRASRRAWSASTWSPWVVRRRNATSTWRRSGASS